jgi:hypothetical protein
MHFDPREQRALRAVGLTDEAIEAASERVVAATLEAADALETFFADRAVVYSDMDRAHSEDEVHRHEVAYLDLFTHADDIRGYLRFETWGVPVEGGRVLSEEVVELTLGSTARDRVRFAADRAAL